MNATWFILPVMACAALLPGAEPVGKPNILLIVADDLGWNDVGYHGAHILTPNIDRLVATGVELDQHYVQPVCTPTRAALLTGRYPSRFGPHVCFPSNRRALPPGTETLASALRAAGYDTALAGKWHLGSRMEWGPRRYGFNRSYGILTGASDPWTHQYRPGPYVKTWHRDEQFLDEQGNLTELLAEEALGWIRAKRRPWLIYLPFTAVHIPIDAPEPYKKLYTNRTYYDDPVKDESLRRYAAFTSQLDAKIGQLVDALETTGQRAQTLIVFTSDNGGLPSGGNPYVGEVPPAPVAGNNKPLRGQKAQLYEGGIRVPAFVNWPGRLEPRKVTAPIHAVDWMPTLTRLIGVHPQADLLWDGQDVWPLITGQVPQPKPRTLYWAYGKNNAIRQGDWKLIAFADGKTELFNLAADPGETENVARQHPARVESLKALLQQIQTHDLHAVPPDLVNAPQ